MAHRFVRRAGAHSSLLQQTVNPISEHLLIEVCTGSKTSSYVVLSAALVGALTAITIKSWAESFKLATASLEDIGAQETDALLALSSTVTVTS